MRRNPLATGQAVLCAAILAILGGCSRTPQEPVADTAAPAESVPSADAPTPEHDGEAAHADLPLVQIWSCDDGRTLTIYNLPRENAVSIEQHEGARKLPQVVSASGARYSDGSLTFWTRGDEATFERTGTAPTRCRLDRYQSTLADARARGVRYRGTGNEPGWHVEVGPDSRLLWVTGYGSERHEFDSSEVRAGDTPGQQVFDAVRGDETLRVTVTREPCTDDMSGTEFDHRMTVESRGQSYRGCATALR